MKKILVLALLIAFCGSVEAVQRVPAHQVKLDTNVVYNFVAPASHLQVAIETLDDQAQSNKTATAAAVATNVLQQAEIAEIDGLQTTNLVQEADIDTNQADIAVLQTNLQTNTITKAQATNYVSYLMYHVRAKNAHSQADTKNSYLMTWIDDAPQVEYDPLSIWNGAGSYLDAPTNGFYSMTCSAYLSFEDEVGNGSMEWALIASSTNTNSTVFGGSMIWHETPSAAVTVHSFFQLPSPAPINGLRVYPLFQHLGSHPNVSNIVISQVELTLMYYGPTLPEDL